MAQNEKDILLKELCARLPYGVKCEDIIFDFVGTITDISVYDNMCKLYTDYGDNCPCFMLNCRPYLFPLSSMSDEQKKEWSYTLSSDGNITYDTVDWLHENHFDYRGLIEKRLAIDATGLNIY